MKTAAMTQEDFVRILGDEAMGVLLQHVFSSESDATIAALRFSLVDEVLSTSERLARCTATDVARMAVDIAGREWQKSNDARTTRDVMLATAMQTIALVGRVAEAQEAVEAARLAELQPPAPVQEAVEVPDVMDALTRAGISVSPASRLAATKRSIPHDAVAAQQVDDSELPIETSGYARVVNEEPPAKESWMIGIAPEPPAPEEESPF